MNPLSYILELDEKLQHLEDLIKSCHNRIWLALRQTVTFNKGNFRKLEEFKRRLNHQYNFYLAELPIVMRSVAAITTCSNTYSQNINFGDERSCSFPIDTVTGRRPFVMRSASKPRCLKKVLRKTFSLFDIPAYSKKNVKIEQQPLVIIASRMFEYITELMQALEEYTCLVYIVHEWDSDVTIMKDYLNNQSQSCILFTDIDTFSGMEALNVLYLCDRNSIARDGMLRAVANLTYAMIGCYDYYEKFIKSIRI